ncbi:MAG: metalloregulator ArsR/SmtB family transcription factor [Desulfuromonadales bacterium]|nr:metalloregulator ArsR/SmtB family transcription factor [Desulfuromonadales bacterium]MDW7756558.1 metalloregulator ArsR/SmtB family transcription factor [Desulfuromonadales bacterium]
MKQTAKQFKALSDETRLRILSLLGAGELCVCDLMAVLELPQSTVSRHLATLRNATLVEDRRQGVWMYYRLTVDDSFLLGLLEKLAITPQGKTDRAALQDFLTKKNTGCT